MPPNNNSTFHCVHGLGEERRTLFDGALRLFHCRGCFEPLPLFRVVPSSSVGTDDASGKGVTCSSQFLKQWFCRPVTRTAAISLKKETAYCTRVTHEAQSPLLVCVFSAGQERLFLELRKRLMMRTSIMQLTMCVEIQVHATILAGALTVDNY